MSKRLILILALAFVVGIACTAYAEVQNVKLSGDLTVYGINRNNYSQTGSGGLRSVTVGTKSESRDNYMTITRVKVDADLTDNVAATVRLINERDWLTESSTSTQNNIDLDLAYVTLKEFLYSPLTLKVGRQEIRIGSGLVIGDGTRVDNTSLIAPDLSSRKAFDAIVAILDYDPLTVSLGTAKLVESAQTGTDDNDAYLLDAIYKLGGKYNAVVDASYLLSYDSSDSNVGSPGTKGQATHVVDLRLTADPMKNLSAELEYARQFGVYSVGLSNAGWALTAGAKYSLADIKKIAKYAPVLGVKYDYRSGNKVDYTKDFKAWRALYEDQVNGVIYDPNSNISIVNVSGSIKPTEDTILSANYYNYRFAQKLVTADNGTNKPKRDAGDELDLNLTYNYTEDVSFGLLGAMYWPGSAYVSDKTATELLGSMKVTF